MPQSLESPLYPLNFLTASSFSCLFSASSSTALMVQILRSSFRTSLSAPTTNLISCSTSRAAIEANCSKRTETRDSAILGEGSLTDSRRNGRREGNGFAIVIKDAIGILLPCFYNELEGPKNPSPALNMVKENFVGTTCLL